MSDILQIGGFVLGLGSLLVSLVVAMLARRKQNAETDSILVEATKGLIEPLKKRLDELNAELETERNKNAQMEARVRVLLDEMRETRYTNAQLLAGVTRLSHQVQALGQTPVFDPGRDLQPWPLPLKSGDNAA